MSRINIHKSPGPDGLQNWILRDFSAQLAGPVCAIFNASIREGFVPGRWKEANVVPVPKAHPPRSIESDLRPISLTSTLGKLLESIVGTWILERIDDKLDNRPELSTGHFSWTRPDPTRRNVDPTRPDPRLPTKSLTRPDPTRCPTLPQYV